MRVRRQYLEGFEAVPFSYNTCGLHSGVWGVDCAPHQGYKVCVVIAPCEY